MDGGVLRYLRVTNSDHDEDATFENRIWILDSQLGYRLCTVLDNAFSDVLVGFRDEQGYFEKKRVEKNGTEQTSRNCLADDLCCLTEPNSATVLDALSRRYQQGTYSGLFCVVMNPWRNLPIYSEEVMEEYRCSVGDHFPHVYTVAQEAYDGILRGGRNQSILITGESGAGKTENTKKIIDFILHCCGSDDDGSLGSAVVTAGVLLEAFGNARTTHNNNSSRFGKFMKVDFNENGKLVSSQIECYLLEKSRVVSQNEGDRNFHIFYQILSNGMPSHLKARLKLPGVADNFKFLNQGGVIKTPDIDDSKLCQNTLSAMNRIGFTENDQQQIFELVAACIMIGEIRFGERSGMDLSFVERQQEVDHVADLLQLKANRIVDALTSPTIKVGDKLIRKNQNLKKTLFSASAMAKVIYERLFNYLLERCNDAIGEKNVDMMDSSLRRFIGVLDIAGFEIMQRNSFEQFCINFTNEKLQQFFNHFMFIKEQAEYEEEGIAWSHINYAEDLQPTISLFEKPMGMFSLLEEECVVPNGSDQSLLDKFCANLSDTQVFSKAKQSKKNKLIVHFTVQHYAGNVDYNIDSWIEKNRDVVETSVLSLLAESAQPLLKKLFPPVVTGDKNQRRGTICNASVTYNYRNQLQSLLDCLNLSAAHFVRCVIPNYERVPGKIDGPLILHQLKCNGVLEGIRICRKGYPSRLTYTDFLQRYSVLGGATFNGVGREGCRQLLAKINLDKERFAIGKSRVFFKVGVIPELEEMRRNYLSNMLIKLQSYIRWHLAVKDADSRRKKNAATLVVQDNVRIFSHVANWDWFRLLSLVRPLIPKDRERLRIEELEQKIRQLEEENQKAMKDNERLNRKMTKLEEEHLRELAQLRKEKLEMEEKLRRQAEANAKEYHDKVIFLEKELSETKKKHEKAIFDSTREMQRRLEEACAEAAMKNKEMKNKMEAELESLHFQLEAALKAKAELEKKQEQNSNSWKARCEMAEKTAETLREALEKLKAEKDKEMEKLKNEIGQSEDIYELLEKKYNEQHQKKMNDNLRSYERELEQQKMNNEDLTKELKRTQDALERELEEREELLREHGGCTQMIAQLEATIAKLNEEISHLKLQIAKMENETEDEKNRNKRHNDTISELQKLISELNEKVARFDQIMLEEKNKRRKLEREKETLEEHLAYAKENYDRLRKKYENLKDELRQRDNIIKQLEKRLEDKEAVMKDCVKELKDSHKQRQSELEEKLEDYKRKNNKLESENSLQKMKLETTFEKEGSVDSDCGYGTSSYRSALGRQYSLTSLSSFSSFRTLNRRRETEPELSTSLYLPRRQSIDYGMPPASTLVRTSSTSNIEKDKRIGELERQVQILNTDLNIQRRELEVYKQTVSTVEAERDRLMNLNRTQQLDLENAKRQMDRSEANADTLAMRLKRAQEDSEMWKKKHEEVIKESKNEILVERKRSADRVESIREEQKKFHTRMESLESVKEELNSELYHCQAELDRAFMTIRDLEQNVQSQEMLGDNIESNYKSMMVELEALKEENALLKARNRRQTKQIELLTQQDNTEDIVHHMETKIAV